MKKSRVILYFLLGFLILSVWNGMRWVSGNFGDISFTLLLFNLLAPKDGMDYTVVRGVVLSFLGYPLLATSILVGAYVWLNTYVFSRYQWNILMIKSNKNIIWKYKDSKWYLWILIGILVVELWGSASSLGAIEYIQNRTNASTLYEDHYVSPEEMDFVFPEQKKNIIYITLESVENTYSSPDVGGVKPVNVIPNLTKLYQENTNFSTGKNIKGFYPAVGTEWTVASLTSQFLGVPLTLPIGQNDYTLDQFLPGTYGLGDVLSEAGYNQSVIIGSDSGFGGRDMLYKGHGMNDVMDYPRALEEGVIPEGYEVFWGFEDAKLFEMCKEQITKLAKEEEPFLLSTLTVDTHFEDGYICQDCTESFGDQYSNAISCSDSKVYEFVQWIQEQDFYEDTVIVIAGDHFTMDSNYLDGLPEGYDRTVYYTIINPDDEVAGNVQKLDRNYTTFDLYPTTLASMGITWGQDRLALGTNLYGETPTLLEEMGLEELNHQIERYSKYYNGKLLYGE